MSDMEHCRYFYLCSDLTIESTPHHTLQGALACMESGKHLRVLDYSDVERLNRDTRFAMDYRMFGLRLPGGFRKEAAS